MPLSHALLISRDIKMVKQRKKTLGEELLELSIAAPREHDPESAEATLKAYNSDDTSDSGSDEELARAHYIPVR